MTSSASFTDSGGMRWTVYECPASRIVLHDRLVNEAPAHLTFETTFEGRTVLRRLREYPESWRDLSPATLEDLCHRAARVGGGRGGRDTDALRRSVDQLTT